MRPQCDACFIAVCVSNVPVLDWETQNHNLSAWIRGPGGGTFSQEVFNLTQQILKLNATHISTLAVTTFTQGLVNYWWGVMKSWFHTYALITTVVVIVGCGLLICFFS